MTPISIEDACRNLPELLRGLDPGEELTIVDDDQPLARIVGEKRQPNQTRKPGMLRGSVLHMADDFDEPLADFEEWPSH